MYDIPMQSGEFTGKIPVKAGVKIEAGAIFAINSQGHAINVEEASPSDRVMGRADTYIDNRQGGNGDATIVGRRGVFHLKNDFENDPLLHGSVGDVVEFTSSDTVGGVNGGLSGGKLLGFTGSDINSPDTLCVVEIR